MSDDLTAAWTPTALRRIWWLPVLRGVVLLVLGLFMLVQPLGTVKALVWVFGVFAIIDGLIAIARVAGQPQGAGCRLVADLRPGRDRVRRDRGRLDRPHGAR